MTIHTDISHCVSTEQSWNMRKKISCFHFCKIGNSMEILELISMKTQFLLWDVRDRWESQSFRGSWGFGMPQIYLSNPRVSVWGTLNYQKSAVIASTKLINPLNGGGWVWIGFWGEMLFSESVRVAQSSPGSLAGFGTWLNDLSGLCSPSRGDSVTHQGPGLGTVLFDVFVDHISTGSKNQPSTEGQGHQTIENPRLVWGENRWEKTGLEKHHS